MDVTDQTSLLYLHKISKTTELLNSILKRLLVLNKINHAKPNLSEINLHTLVDQVISIQMKKGLPDNLVVRKNIIHDAPVHTDKELMSILLENTIDNALKFCDRSVDKEHFIEINVVPTNNGRVNVRVVDNRETARDFAASDIYNIFQGSEFETDGAEAEKQDLYFVKTAAKKIGGKVNVGKTPEGYNELTLVF
jgi:light-regulated signal transduction histidine kinase (bacteriophytochrome)